jgi:hypothetical protein
MITKACMSPLLGSMGPIWRNSESGKIRNLAEIWRLQSGNLAAAIWRLQSADLA